ncbi:MAG: hypothetical protein IKI82_00240, partial [Lachnospiraceae bacterium]|nr:hypothetical protein [Lachnospiraceae bacterium]
QQGINKTLFHFRYLLDPDILPLDFCHEYPFVTFSFLLFPLHPLQRIFIPSGCTKTEQKLRRVEKKKPEIGEVCHISKNNGASVISESFTNFGSR